MIYLLFLMVFDGLSHNKKCVYADMSITYLRFESLSKID